ncbi:MAG: MBL fold metallo-hydrolase, partial [Clostridia bacterium]|nr:MBL fold metallo-hydrolase [Clostridia bacterium]
QKIKRFDSMMNIKCFAMSCNCYIVSDENGKAVVFDPGENGAGIYDYIKREGLELCAVMITHAHFDHIYGLRELVECAKSDGKVVPVYVHTADAFAMTDSQANLSGPLFGMPYRYTGTLKGTFDGDQINVGNMSFLVISTPGHTNGCACYICHKEQCVFAGDVLFEGSIGRTDFPGGDMGKMKKSLERLMDLYDPYVVYPGHGSSTTIGDERNYNPYIAGL